MSIKQQSSFALAKSSPEEGLDFACSLVSNGIIAEAQSNPGKAPDLLGALARYIQLRYVGELGLALDELSDIGATCENEEFQRKQFWSQLHWVAQAMSLPPEQVERLRSRTG